MEIFLLGPTPFHTPKKQMQMKQTQPLGRQRFTKAGTEKGQRMLLGGPELAIQQMPKVVTAVRGGDVG